GNDLIFQTRIVKADHVGDAYRVAWRREGTPGEAVSTGSEILWLDRGDKLTLEVENDDDVQPDRPAIDFDVPSVSLQLFRIYGASETTNADSGGSKSSP